MPMNATEFTRQEIDTGRRLFAGEWRFVAAAGTPVSLPPMRGVEIAFAGRSNVGKSSLINALTGRKNLARISNTPGRTQELIFFTGGDSLNIVDMPGYGYAAAAKSKIAAWTELIDHSCAAAATSLGSMCWWMPVMASRPPTIRRSTPWASPPSVIRLF